VPGIPGRAVPRTPNGIYFFNTKTKALISVSNSVATTPNGLTFSPDGSTFYVADSNSASGKPMSHSPSSLLNVWAFDVKGSILSNPRLVYSTEAGGLMDFK
jgi:gluconolactonase